MKIFLNYVSLLLLTVATAGADTLNFDDLTASGAGIYGKFSIIPTNYGNLQWDTFYVYQASNSIPSGYLNGAVSSPNVAFNNQGHAASISSTTPFNLTSAYLTAALNDNLFLSVVGKGISGQVYSISYTLSAVSPTLANFNFLSVTNVSFTSSGGTQHSGYAGSGTQFAMDNMVYSTSVFYATISNVRASQRTGTNLVDIYYDLAGLPAPASISVLFSTNSGSNYNIQPVKLSGDGVTTNVPAGANYHMVWNAGIDFSNKYCPTARIQLSENAGGSPSQAASPIFTLDTRNSSAGVIIGRVMGSGHPLTNAPVRIENMPFGTNTLSDGTFIFMNVPVANGYVVDVSAVGYISRRLTSQNVPSSSTNNLGDIVLTNITGGYRLVPLVPDINPAVTMLEQGGTAYRYYLALNSSNGPQGAILVSAQISGGNAIVQTNDVSNYWPGRIAGISDPINGIVRISIPATALNANGTIQSIQLSISNILQQTFQAQIVPRQYDQVWKQIVGGGGGVDIFKGVSGEIDTAAESELRHKINGGMNTSETISRSREAKFKVGAGIPGGFDVGASLKTSNINVQGKLGASADVGLYLAIILDSEFLFDPGTQDANQNVMKIYVNLGNVLTGTPIGNQLYTQVDKVIAPNLLAVNLKSTEGDIKAGAEVQGQVGLSIANNQKSVQIPIGMPPPGYASGSIEGELVWGHKETYGNDANSASIFGYGYEGSGLLAPPSNFSDKIYTIGGGSEFDQFTWEKLPPPSSFDQPAQTSKIDRSKGTAYSTPTWQIYDPSSLYLSYARTFTESLAVTANGSPTNYQWSVFASQVGTQARFTFDVVISLNFSLEADTGTEIVNERGTLLQRPPYDHWPTESYPAITADLFPTETWSSIVNQWGTYATAPIVQAIHQVVTVVKNAGNTIVSAGQATLNVVGGALSSGSQVISSWASGLFSSNSLLVSHGISPKGGPISSSYLPPDGSSNYVYGIDGVYRFTCTNTFSGTATLVIPYSNADITSLNASDLRIYQLPDGSNRWQLVGGSVSLISNTVTAAITNLGTFAIAPPLPTGDLQLISSTNSLPANGTSQMTITVTNIVLNNSLLATQQWLFTVNDTGIQLLNPDIDTNLTGIQVTSTNGSITLRLQAPAGGNVAHISLASVAGDAYGTATVNLIDTTPPVAPANVAVTAGQSRIWISWQTNSESDLSGYRVYYNPFTAGPPWSGMATVEGSPSPVQVTGTNCLLRGLSLGTNYYVAVSAVDSTGNESPLSAVKQVTTAQAAPAPPTALSARIGYDGTNLLMWALSEDDGYNDRDVAQYYIWRAILPGGSYVKIGQVPAGIGIFCETNTPVTSTQSVNYAVTTVDNFSLSSAQALALAMPTANLVIGTCKLLPGGTFQMTIANCVVGQGYTLQTSTNLFNWVTSGVYSNFVCTNTIMIFNDSSTPNSNKRFYRITH